MLTVHFTPHLSRFFPLPETFESAAPTLDALMDDLEANWPGLRFYLIDEQRALRENVAIWVDRKRLLDPGAMRDPLPERAVVHIMQALSGG